MKSKILVVLLVWMSLFMLAGAVNNQVLEKLTSRSESASMSDIVYEITPTPAPTPIIGGGGDYRWDYWDKLRECLLSGKEDAYCRQYASGLIIPTPTLVVIIPNETPKPTVTPTPVIPTKEKPFNPFWILVLAALLVILLLAFVRRKKKTTNS